MQWHSDRLCLAFLCLLWHILHEAFLHVIPCQAVQVAHPATYITVEDKDITDDLQLWSRREVCLIENIAFLNGEVEGVSIHGYFAPILQECLIACVAHLLAPMEKHAKKIHCVDDGSV